MTYGEEAEKKRVKERMTMEGESKEERKKRMKT